ncbi:MAG: hypothetical protein ACMXYG_05355 [Candidatus Woesearchaeota archaeon]
MLRKDLEAAVNKIRTHNLREHAIVEEILRATQFSGVPQFTSGYRNSWLTSGWRNSWATSGWRNSPITSGHYSVSAAVDYIMQQIPENE